MFAHPAGFSSSCAHIVPLILCVLPGRSHLELVLVHRAATPAVLHRHEKTLFDRMQLADVASVACSGLQ